MPVVSTENVSVFIPLILRGKVSGSGGRWILRGGSRGGLWGCNPPKHPESKYYF